MIGDVDLVMDHVICAEQQIGHGDFPLHGIRRSVDIALAIPRQVITASRKVFDGIVPVLIQTPPMTARCSIIAARVPSLAA